MGKVKLRKFTLPRTDQIPLLGIRNWENKSVPNRKVLFLFYSKKRSGSSIKVFPTGEGNFFFLIE